MLSEPLRCDFSFQCCTFNCRLARALDPGWPAWSSPQRSSTTQMWPALITSQGAGPSSSTCDVRSQCMAYSPFSVSSPKRTYGSANCGQRGFGPSALCGRCRLKSPAPQQGLQVPYLRNSLSLNFCSFRNEPKNIIDACHTHGAQSTRSPRFVRMIPWPQPNTQSRRIIVMSRFAPSTLK